MVAVSKHSFSIITLQYERLDAVNNEINYCKK